MPLVSRSKAWLLLPAALALAWFLPTLAHGWRSDDFLTVYYLDRDGDAVRWGRVWEEWVRPWFGVRDLYRPFVSLTYACNWALGTAAWGFHLCNVLLLAGAACCVGATAARLARARPVLAGLVAGAVVVLHPAAVEPTAWIAARTTGLQVFWSAVAMWTFVRWRQGASGPWWTVAATALACASKEGAVLLPVSFVVLSLLGGERPRARVHGPFVALVVGYLLWRKVLLGWFTTAEEGHTVVSRLAGAGQLFVQLLVPPLGSGWHLGGVFFAALLVLLWQGGAAAGQRRALWCAPWAVLLLLPGTTHVEWGDGLLLGRFVFDAVPALALFTALAVDVAPAGALARARFAVGVLGLGAGLCVGSRVWLDRYTEESRLVATVQRELLAAARHAGPGAPFGVVALPGQPLLQPGLWGFLTQRPFAPVDLPVSGFAALLEQDDANPRVFANAAPIHALVQHGAGFASWDVRRGSFVAVPKAIDEVVELVRDANDPSRFLPPRPLSPTAFAAIELRPWRGLQVDLEVLGDLPGPLAARTRGWRFSAGAADPSDPHVRAEPPPAQVWFDTTDVVSWFVLQAIGSSPQGVRLTADGRPPPPEVAVRVHARIDELRARQDVPARCTVEQFAAALQPPEDRGDYVLTVLAPTGVFACGIGRGAGGSMPAEMVGQLRFCADVLGRCRLHWFWQTRDPLPEGRPARSRFGTCEVY